MTLTTLGKKVQPVCAECGSSDIRVEAYIVWNVNKQNWEIEEVIDDHQVCNRCGHGMIPRWKMLEAA